MQFLGKAQQLQVAKRARKKLEKLNDNFDQELADELRERETKLREAANSRNLKIANSLYTVVKYVLTVVASLDVMLKIYYFNRQFFANESLESTYKWFIALRFIGLGILAISFTQTDRDRYRDLRISILTLKVEKDAADPAQMEGGSGAKHSSGSDSDEYLEDMKPE